MTRRIIPIIGAAAALFLLVQATLFAQDQTKPKTAVPKTVPFKLTATLKQRAVVDTVKGNVTMTGDISFVSPKAPPYKMEVNCHSLVANGLSETTTTMLKASDNVMFNAIIPPKGQAAGQKKSAEVRIDGQTELLIYEIAKDPVDSTTARLVKLVTAKDSSGKEVIPKLTIKSAGSAPANLDSPVIIINLDTGKIYLEKSINAERDEQ